MVGNPNAWWGTEPIHGGEATYMVAWPASRPALVGGQVGWGPGGRAGPAQGRALLAPFQPGHPPMISGFRWESGFYLIFTTIFFVFEREP